MQESCQNLTLKKKMQIRYSAHAKTCTNPKCGAEILSFGPPTAIITQWHLDKPSNLFFCDILRRGNPPRSGRDMVAHVQGREAVAAPGKLQA